MSESPTKMSETAPDKSDYVSKCVLRVEVDNPAEESGAEASSDVSQKVKYQRTPRDISVETFPSRLEGPREDWGLLPACSRETTPLAEGESEESEIGFFSGNPFVEITKGILHLYKEDVLTDRKEALTLCLLGVPNSMTCHDLLDFTAPCHPNIAHIRILRDSLPNQYMALLTFRSHDSALEFYETFNERPFNSLESENICRIVWVSRVEWAHDGLPPPGHTELPICPVCLERMDESVDGVLTILCNHAFHANCLDQWSDLTCPVCRCVQSPEQAASSECDQCGKSTGTLWICLICGHVGCGRYQGGHAHHHYEDTGHCYALELGTNRVWDYKGDNFVHRLLQNKTDGKLVASERPPSEAEGVEEKVDSVQLEFTHILTSQLEQQRLYYEEKKVVLKSRYEEEIEELQSSLLNVLDENKELKSKLTNINKEKVALERKITQQSAKLTATIGDLTEERQLGKALRNNQQQWQDKLAKLQEEIRSKDKTIAELNEQVRDLAFFIDARQTIEQSEDREEIAGGTVTIGEGRNKNQRRGGRKKK